MKKVKPPSLKSCLWDCQLVAMFLWLFNETVDLAGPTQEGLMVDTFRKNAMAAKLVDISGTKNASRSGDMLGEVPLLESLVF
jgi:hypothetical protein